MSSLVTGKYRRSTTYTVEFPTLPSISAQPRRVEIHQKQYQHDVVLFEFSQVSPLWFDVVRTGTPVSFSWTQGATTKFWYGYVSFVTKNVSSQIDNVMEVHCIGTSFPLKTRVTRVFKNTTIPSAVATIASEFGFNFIGKDNDRVFEQLTIAGHSYWEWMQEQARRIGYGVFVDGMDLYFRPLDELITQGVSTVPVLSMSGTQANLNGQLLDRTLDWFKALNGEYVEDSQNLRTVKQVGGVDPITQQVYTSSKSPKNVGTQLRANVNDVLFSEVRSEQVISDPISAASAASGAANMARMNTPAKVKCQGDPRIRPFYPVLIQGTGPTTDGYWIAKEVKHMFAKIGDYQIEMTVTVDGTGANKISGLRQGTTTAVGVVNLNEALSNNGVNIDASSGQTVRLVTSSFMATDAAQGYNRTPARWKHGVKK